MEVNSFDFAKNRKFPSLLAMVITQIYNFCNNESIVRYKFTQTNDFRSLISTHQVHPRAEVDPRTTEVRIAGASAWPAEKIYYLELIMIA